MILNTVEEMESRAFRDLFNFKGVPYSRFLFTFNYFGDDKSFYCRDIKEIKFYKECFIIVLKKENLLFKYYNMDDACLRLLE